MSAKVTLRAQPRVTIMRGTGPRHLVAAQRGPTGRPGTDFYPTHFVDLIGDRAAFDAEPAGVTVVVHSDSGHGDEPWIYAKASAASGDWTAGNLWRPDAIDEDALDPVAVAMIFAN